MSAAQFSQTDQSTISQTGVMMGIKGTITVGPSGAIMAVLVGQSIHGARVQQPGVPPTGLDVRICYSSGAPPQAGDPAQGIEFTRPIEASLPQTGGLLPHTIAGVVTGQPPGSVLWFDGMFLSWDGHSVAYNNIQLSLFSP